MLKEIDEHKLNNDMGLCYKLAELIFTRKIESEEKLKEIEDSYFPTTDVEVRVNMCFYDFVSDYTHIEQCDGNTMYEVLNLKERFNNSNDLTEKLYCIMKIYDLIGWEFRFPYTAYKLITVDKLK